MKKLFLFTLFCSLALLSSYGITLSGKVTNEKGQPLQYVSVYLKNQPTYGTITDVSGNYSLEVEISNRDILLFSLVGYEQKQIEINSFAKNRQIDVKMTPQPVMLHTIAVEPPTQNQKKFSKKEKQTILESVYSQLKVDFPNKPITYSVVSDMTTGTGKEVLLMEEAIGTITEYPNRLGRGRDSVYMKVEKFKRYVEPTLKESLKQVEISSFSKKEQKGFASFGNEETNLHKEMWTLDLEQLFFRYYEDVKHWKITQKNKNCYLLTYNNTRNLMGVIKLTQTLVLEVRRDNYRILNLSERLKINVNIPFGYKLSEGDLQVLNSLTLGNTSFEKYRLKRLSATTTRNAIFNRTSSRSVVREKSFIATGYIEDNKGNRVSFNNRSKIDVLNYSY